MAGLFGRRRLNRVVMPMAQPDEPPMPLTPESTLWDEQHKRCRRLWFITLAGVPLFLIVSASTFAATSLFRRETAMPAALVAGAATAILHFIACVTAKLQLLLWRCPRCHKRYFGSLPAFDARWASNKTCFYCKHGRDFSPRMHTQSPSAQVH